MSAAVTTRIKGGRLDQHIMIFTQNGNELKPTEISLLISMAGNGAVATAGISTATKMENPRPLEMSL